MCAVWQHITNAIQRLAVRFGSGFLHERRARGTGRFAQIAVERGEGRSLLRRRLSCPTEPQYRKSVRRRSTKGAIRRHPAQTAALVFVTLVYEVFDLQPAERDTLARFPYVATGFLGGQRSRTEAGPLRFFSLRLLFEEPFDEGFNREPARGGLLGELIGDRDGDGHGGFTVARGLGRASRPFC